MQKQQKRRKKERERESEREREKKKKKKWRCKLGSATLAARLGQCSLGCATHSDHRAVWPRPCWPGSRWPGSRWRHRCSVSWFYFWFFFFSSLSSLMRRRLKMHDFTCFVGLAYKSSLKDLISRWSPCEKNATSDVIKPWISSLLDSRCY